MCSTIRPCPGASYFSLLQTRHFWKALMSSSHQKLILGYLLSPSLRSGVLKCARLAALVRVPTILGFLQTRHFCKASISSAHQKSIVGYLLTPSLKLGGSECARPTAPVPGPAVSVSFKPRILVKPQPVALTKSWFSLFAHTKPKAWSLGMCSTIRPCPGASYFSFLQTRHFQKTPTNSSHQKLMLGYLPTPTKTCGGWKCTRLSAPV